MAIRRLELSIIRPGDVLISVADPGGSGGSGPPKILLLVSLKIPTDLPPPPHLEEFLDPPLHGYAGHNVM